AETAFGTLRSLQQSLLFVEADRVDANPGLLGNLADPGRMAHCFGSHIRVQSGVHSRVKNVWSRQLRQLVGGDLPDVTSKPELTSGSRGQKIAKWFTTASFLVNTPGTFGSAGRNILTGLGMFNEIGRASCRERV